MGVHPQPSARADFSIMVECTPDIGNGHSVCTVFCGCDPTRAGSGLTEIMFKPFVCLIVEHFPGGLADKTDISSVKLQMFKTSMKKLRGAQEAKKMRLTLPG
jgi:hypothetical protein